MKTRQGSGKGITIREIAIFAMLGTMMYVSKKLMEWAPNIHFLAVLTVTYTLVYRKKALIPIYVYVLMNGFFEGFATWWIPYLYLWGILWGMAMLIPRNLPVWLTAIISSFVCALHGIAFGTLYAPFQALVFGLSFKSTIAWIVQGLPFDVVHCLGNLAGSVLTIPLVTLLCRLEKKPLPFKVKKQSTSV